MIMRVIDIKHHTWLVPPEKHTWLIPPEYSIDGVKHCVNWAKYPVKPKIPKPWDLCSPDSVNEIIKWFKII
jgi:hypothetical protein